MRAVILFYVVAYGPSLPLLYGLVLLARRRQRPRWARALGWLALWVVPAVAYQAAWWLSDASPHSATVRSVLLASPVALWVLLGGGTVVAVFEATTRTVTGHRSCTMFDNVHWYLALTALQTALLVALLLRRREPYHRDRLALAIGVACLCNGLVAAPWPWWGT